MFYFILIFIVFYVLYFHVLFYFRYGRTYARQRKGHVLVLDEEITSI